MRSLLGAFLVIAATSSTANAASLSVTPDKLTYLVGETITLQVAGDDGGASSYGIFGRLDYSGALVNNGTRTQIQLIGQYAKWTTGTLSQADDGIDAYSWVFNQISGVYAQTATNLPGPLATVTLIAQAIGTVVVDWHLDAGDGTELFFFGLTDAPGTSFTIVPEPATAALLALGLLALGAVRGPRGA